MWVFGDTSETIGKKKVHVSFFTSFLKKIIQSVSLLGVVNLFVKLKFLKTMKEEKKIQNEELQSRREFFKKAGKGLLPVLGAIALMNMPLMAKTVDVGADPQSCGSCRGTCTACVGGCMDNCARSCTACSNGCARGCHATCYTGCNGSNKNYA